MSLVTAMLLAALAMNVFAAFSVALSWVSFGVGLCDQKNIRVLDKQQLST